MTILNLTAAERHAMAQLELAAADAVCDSGWLATLALPTLRQMAAELSAARAAAAQEGPPRG